MTDTLTTTIESPIGPLTLIARDGVLTDLSMHQQRHGSPPPDNAVTDDPWFKDVTDQLDAYFVGELSSFDVAVNLVGTPFQRNVRSRLCARSPTARPSRTAIWRNGSVSRRRAPSGWPTAATPSPSSSPVTG